MEKTTCSLQSSRRKIILAFAILYVVWGSTYLAIKVAIDTVPPLMMGSLRFIIAGLLLYCVLPASERERPTLRQWRSAAIIGGLLLTVGNGGVVLSEKWISTGIVSLLVAMTPMFIAVLESFPKFAIGRRKAAGLILGTSGISMLVNPASFASGNVNLAGIIVLLIASSSWAIGSIYSRSAEKPRSTMMFVAMQMVCGGIALGALSLTMGEHVHFDVRTVSAQSLFAVAYLIVFGSILGYGAYIWLLRNVSPTRVSTYAYVNPVIAVFLGWAVCGEPLGPATMGAAALILGAVWLINSKSREIEAPPAVADPPVAVLVAVEIGELNLPESVVRKDLAVTRGNVKG